MFGPEVFSIILVFFKSEKNVFFKHYLKIGIKTYTYINFLSKCNDGLFMTNVAGDRNSDLTPEGDVWYLTSDPVPS